MTKDEMNNYDKWAREILDLTEGLSKDPYNVDGRMSGNNGQAMLNRNISLHAEFFRLDKSTKRLECLTKWLILLTFFLGVLTTILIFKG